MGFEQEAVDELWTKVWSHKSAMQRDLNRGAHGEVFVLRQLMEFGQMTPSQLASALRVSSGRVSTLLSALEKKGYVTRENDPDDRRVVRVRLTDAGREAVRHDVDAMRDAVCWIFSQMGERRTREFVDLTREFMTYMSICRPGKPRPTAEEVRKAFEEVDSSDGWSCPVAGNAAAEGSDDAAGAGSGRR
ncbi:MarR family transcriptional regulator [Bifidobacterium sp. CP2]|uniref:MarR family winged helix-turn-helix transcriptional regulator n=1 Tax=Bifidobacterium sp. CP2 TaxID=2809025 RepID=UPI001BDC68FC|nr:MarR family transcriptional regulator [Bifidobacterium sp. CP2]MBT1181362.1 MarR family transcriptional regulator [Bifidobacterium sp. CP2]